ncbi:MAG: tRNA epoxyqueuosine(34) reductase QueG [Alphaproteobacteria bacterium]
MNVPTHTADTGDLRAAIRERALALGFDAVGFADAAASTELRQRLDAFVDAGWYGDMGWLAANADRRGDPAALWPGARSVVAVAASYRPATDPLAVLGMPDRGGVSVYARTGRDYHDALKKRLRDLGRWLATTQDCEARAFVDTAPVMEKPLAQAAGLGWQGKHTNLVSRPHGSWLFLGELFTTMPLAPDAPETDHCGSCRRCLDACPTAAFPAPYRLDARRCISYLTIEHKGHIAAEFRAPMGNRIYGCDDCLAVCPWNKFAQTAPRMDELLPRVELTAPRLAELAELDDAGFRALFAGSPIKRTGRDRFVRNVLIAIGNSGRPALVPTATARLDDPSPLVRAMAIWALSRLLPAAAFDALRAERQTHESDDAVRAEWGGALRG